MEIEDTNYKVIVGRVKRAISHFALTISTCLINFSDCRRTDAAYEEISHWNTQKDCLKYFKRHGSSYGEVALPRDWGLEIPQNPSFRFMRSLETVLE